MTMRRGKCIFKTKRTIDVTCKKTHDQNWYHLQQKLMIKRPWECRETLCCNYTCREC